MTNSTNSRCRGAWDAWQDYMCYMHALKHIDLLSTKEMPNMFYAHLKAHEALDRFFKLTDGKTND